MPVGAEPNHGGIGWTGRSSARCAVVMIVGKPSSGSPVGPGGPSTGLVSAARQSAAIARQLGYRSAASLAMARRVTSSNPDGSVGTRLDGGGARLFRCPYTLAATESPGNGTVPVSSL